MCYIQVKNIRLNSFYEEKKIKLCLTKQLLNMFKLWCEWGISLFKMSPLWKGQLPWIFFFAFERWKIKEKLPAKLSRINTRTMHSWQKKNMLVSIYHSKLSFFDGGVIFYWTSSVRSAQKVQSASIVLAYYQNIYVFKRLMTNCQGYWNKRLTKRLLSFNQLLMTSFTFN